MKIARRIVRCAALAAMIAAAAVCCAVYIATDPDFGGASVNMSPTEKLMQTRTITDGEGRELFKVNGFGRLSADVGELSEHTLNAFIAVEDAVSLSTTDLTLSGSSPQRSKTSRRCGRKRARQRSRSSLPKICG